MGVTEPSSVVKCSLLLLLLLVTSSCSSEARRDEYITKADDFVKQKNDKEALEMYRKAIEVDPMSADAYYRGGLTAVRLREWRDAVRFLERAVGLMPNNLEAHTHLINLYLFFYGLDQSKVVLQQMEDLSYQVHERFPKSYEDERLTAYVALLRGDRPTALQHFAVASNLRPHDGDLALSYMQALMSDGQPAKAEEIAMKALEGKPHAIPLYDALFGYYRAANRVADADRILRLKTSNNPKNGDAFLDLAAWYFVTNRHGEMHKIMADLTANRKDFPLSPLFVGDFYLRLGMFPLAMQNYQAGIGAGGIIKRMCQKRQVDILVKQKKIAEADQLVKALLAEDPQDPEAIAIGASVMLASESKDRLQPAVNSFQAVLPQLPADFVLRCEYCRALLFSGDLGNAVTQCQEAIKQRDDYLAPRAVLAHISSATGKIGIARTLMGAIVANPGLNVPFSTAGQRPQERPPYEAILNIRAQAGPALKDLSDVIAKRTAELDKELAKDRAQQEEQRRKEQERLESER